MTRRALTKEEEEQIPVYLNSPFIEDDLCYTSWEDQLIWSDLEGAPWYFDSNNEEIQDQAIYMFYPEQIYIASVIPTHSPAELREFKHHCITLFTNQTRPTLLFNHDLREIRRITSSALHFQNLLWRKTISISNTSVTESYFWIRRRTLQGRTDQAYLEPADQVTYQYGRNEWTVYQVRNL